MVVIVKIEVIAAEESEMIGDGGDKLKRERRRKCVACVIPRVKNN